MLNTSRMGKIILLNVLETIEKFLCIHRNYTSLCKVLKKLTLLRVGFVIILYVVVVSLEFMNKCRPTQDALACLIMRVYSILSTAVTLVAVVNGIGYAGSYKVFSIKMHEVHEYCKDNVSYKKSMLYLLILVLMLSALYIAIYLWACLGIITQALGQPASNGIYNFFWNVIESSIVTWREFRFAMEFYVFIILIRIMVICLNVMKFNLKTTLKSLEDVEDGLDDINYFELRRDLRKWTAAYNCIALCCDDLKKFYGMQVTLIWNLYKIDNVVIFVHCS